jgi:hypothetical protein
MQVRIPGADLRFDRRILPAAASDSLCPLLPLSRDLLERPAISFEHTRAPVSDSRRLIANVGFSVGPMSAPRGSSRHVRQEAPASAAIQYLILGNDRRRFEPIGNHGTNTLSIAFRRRIRRQNGTLVPRLARSADVRRCPQMSVPVTSIQSRLIEWQRARRETLQLFHHHDVEHVPPAVPPSRRRTRSRGRGQDGTLFSNICSSFAERFNGDMFSAGSIDRVP